MLNIQCFLLHLGAFAPPQLPCGGVSFVRPWWWDAAFRHWHPIEKATLAEARAKGPSIPAPACIFVPDTRLGCRGEQSILSGRLDEASQFASTGGRASSQKKATNWWPKSS